MKNFSSLKNILFLLNGFISGLNSGATLQNLSMGCSLNPNDLRIKLNKLRTSNGPVIG